MISCAVVGNSPIILEKENGEEIDSHDVVVRFNIAETTGYEKFVGSKRTLRFMNCHPILCALDELHLKEHTKYFPEYDNEFINQMRNEELWIKSLPNFNSKSSLYNDLINRGNKIQHISDEWLKEHSSQLGGDPTMGYLGIQYALENFDKVSCYGFSFFQDPAKFHYFESVIPYEQNHAKNKEEQKIRSLHTEGRITLYE
jgi:hypothetical protein